ncbi:hypothetical protein [Paenibacillus xylanilyticus]|uniref:Apea-like HEPN domain-containing protein n=1 Tax=Paenibacillus xylanilyticus TaxID=248903 RepID=A0A7Y6EVZ3_9BACL|nr:hypothetical protein [Paenibacillus xylanilyticus]NUU78802.1 hypothetical protein [Paenibacillus xylanilyticus]
MKDLKEYWVFFPLKGIDISAKDIEIESPLFGDATIISKKNIKQIVEKLRSDKESNFSNHLDEISYMLKNITFKESFHSFLCVKRKGSLSGDKYDQIASLKSHAKDRAYEITALLTLLIWASNSINHFVGLSEQFLRKTEVATLFDFNEKSISISFTGDSSNIISGRLGLNNGKEDLIVFTRADLNSLLNEDRYRTLTEIVINRKNKTVIQACIKIVEAIHSLNTSTKLLDAITAIEVLLLEQGENYDKFKKRIEILIGKDNVGRFRIDELLKARNFYVHRGDSVSNPNDAYDAIKLSFVCLIAISNISDNFKGKQSIVKYLDFINESEKVQSYFEEDDVKILKNLNKHKLIELNLYEILK